MPRLVTYTCPQDHRSGRMVEDDASGVRSMGCQECGEVVLVRLDRTAALIRPTNTPLQRERWATERSRDARDALRALVAAVEAYLPLRDITVEELPPGSPLRVAVERARLELAKTAP